MTAEPRKRRRAVRRSDAENIDRSWDSPEATQAFSEATDLIDPRHSDDFVVVLDEAVADDADESAELTDEFWKGQRPPHFGG